MAVTTNPAEAVFIVCSCRLCASNFRADEVGVALSNMTSNFIKTSQEQLVAFLHCAPGSTAFPGLFMQGSPSVSPENVCVGGRGEGWEAEPHELIGTHI